MKTLESSITKDDIKLKPRINLNNKSNSKQLFSNQEIQQRIYQIARNLSTEELDNLCSPSASKNIFGINFPLFIKTQKNIAGSTKRGLVKEESGINRWT